MRLFSLLRVGNWWRLRWWSPNAKAMRAFERHAHVAYRRLRRHGVDDDAAEDAIQQAFLALRDQYAAGRRIADVPRYVNMLAFLIQRDGAMAETTGFQMVLLDESGQELDRRPDTYERDRVVVVDDRAYEFARRAREDGQRVRYFRRRRRTLSGARPGVV